MSPGLARLPIAAILLAAPLLAGAQLPALLPGTRLRIHNVCEAPSDDQRCAPRITVLHAVHGDTLLVSDSSGQDKSLLLGPTATVDTSGGVHGHALAGLGVGLLLGVGSGLALSGSCESGSDLNLCGLVYLFTVPTGLVLGTISGALIRTERWRPVHGPGVALRLEPVVLPRGAGLSVVLAF